MFCRIFIFVISGTILVASFEANYENGLFNTEREDDRSISFNFRKLGTDQKVVLKSIVDRWVSLMKNKFKNQSPVLKAKGSQSSNVLPRLVKPKLVIEESIENRPPTDEASYEQLQSQEDNNVLTPEHLTSRPWWTPNNIEMSSAPVKKVKHQTEPQNNELQNENKKQTTHLAKQYEIGNMKIPSSMEGKLQLPNTTGNKLVGEAIIIQPSTQRATGIKRNPTSANPSQKINARKAKKIKIKSTAATPESAYKNWGILILKSNKSNKLFEDEHNQLENEIQENKKLTGTRTQTHVESDEVDDDRNKELRNKVDSWYGNLDLFRKKSAERGVSPEISNMVHFRRNLQSALAALIQRRQFSERHNSHAIDNRRLSRWRRQLLSQYSEPQAVDYRRLLSLWQKELRRQLQIKWNRRPLVEVSPGAFKSEIYPIPPDDLSKHMQKLLELKKKQEERNRDLNAVTEPAE